MVLAKDRTKHIVAILFYKMYPLQIYNSSIDLAKSKADIYVITAIDKRTHEPKQTVCFPQMRVLSLKARCCSLDLICSCSPPTTIDNAMRRYTGHLSVHSKKIRDRKVFIECNPKCKDSATSAAWASSTKSFVNFQLTCTHTHSTCWITSQNFPLLFLPPLSPPHLCTCCTVLSPRQKTP